MTLYTADIMDIARPVKKGKKRLPTPPMSEEDSPEQNNLETGTVKKVKREMSEKQKEGLKKAQETRKLKKQQQEKEKQETTLKSFLEEKEKSEALALKKKIAAEKRKLNREKKKREAEQNIDKELDEAVKEIIEKPKKIKVKMAEPKEAKIIPDNPPKWFTQFVTNMKKEEVSQTDSKVPVKQLKEEAKEFAQNKWQDGMVRDKVENELTKSKSRMYKMIFG